MIDSGASACVCGVDRYRRLKSGKEGHDVQSSDKIFRFGDGRRVVSKGYVDLRCIILSMKGGNAAPVQFRSDLVEGGMPLLLSYQVLSDWSSTINFSKGTMSVHNCDILLRASSTGRLYAKICIDTKTEAAMRSPQKPELQGKSEEREAVKTVCAIDIDMVSGVQVKKPHEQLGHDGCDAMIRLFHQSGKMNLDDTIKKCVQNCGRSIDRSVAQRPIVKSHAPARCGEVSGMDVMYPIEGTGHARPFLIVVDHLSRFTVVARMNGHRPEHVVDLLCKMWILQLGRPSKILADRGPAFIGGEWES